MVGLKTINHYFNELYKVFWIYCFINEPFEIYAPIEQIVMIKLSDHKKKTEFWDPTSFPFTPQQ